MKNAEETKAEDTHKAEEPKVDVVRTWRAKMNCQMPWRDFVKNETIELKDSQVDARVKALFECLTPEEAKGKERDPELDVMISRLKAAKVPLRKNMSEKEIRDLFDKFLGNGATASEISKDAQ
jgi:hypothetical protein